MIENRSSVIPLLDQAGGVGINVYNKVLFTPEQCLRLARIVGPYPVRRGMLSSPLPPGYSVDTAGYDAQEMFFNPLEPRHRWFSSIVLPQMIAVGRSLGFGKVSLVETARIVTYAAGGHFHWHRDTFHPPESRMPGNRRLTVSVQLSSRETYEGGRFEIDGENPLNCAQGAVTIFAAYRLHRVAPVTKGIRRSLVLWGY